MPKLLPYGISNFQKLIEENYYYIDKTMYIEKLERSQTPVFLRPRRFGKSLFTETLRWYYDIKAADQFEKLFGSLYIGKNPTPRKNSYLFLALDFSGMSDYSNNDPDFTRRQFNNKVISRLVSFFKYYQDLLKIDDKFIQQFKEEHKSIAHTALSAAMQVVQQAGRKVYLVIDEYDSFTNTMAINYIDAPEDKNEYLNITRKGGFFRSFFEAIKDSTKTALDRVFITGILPITISDINSGFNIAEWIALEDDFSDMLGITEPEMNTLLGEIYQDYPGIAVQVEELKRVLKAYYNGYRFTEVGELIYNPMMAFYYLNSIIHYNRPPRIMADQNIRVQYNQMSYIFGKNNTKRDEVLAEITDKKALSFSVRPGKMFDLTDYKSGTYINECLFYIGLLTFGELPMEFVVPNLVTYEMILSYFERIMDFEIEKKDIDRFVIDYMRSGDIVTFVKIFFEEVIQKFPGDFFKDVNESFYRGLFFHCLTTILPRDMYEVLPEYNVTHGTVDIMIRSLEIPQVPVPLHELIELKRVPKGATDATLTSKFEEAKTQVAGYRVGDYKKFRSIAVCFRGNKDYLIDVVE